ncbi:MAG: YXWGXW repeat-containing protein, partial [Terriglobus roseus]|nr:YXWGXW repeat-containing protein [Terriglobus roseus]
MQPVYPQAGYASTGTSRTTYQRTPAPVTRVAGQVYENPGNATGEVYPNQAPYTTQNESSNYQYQQPYDPNASVQDDQLYSELLDPNTPEAQQPPPELPVYEQPQAPGADYLWTPGYWDYANTGYYYVPGNWVSAPFVGALWTPGWWGYYGHGYRWHHGYWGPHVGYYGGINYGFGFIGIGYQGGYWNRDHFYYNTYVNHVRPEVVNNYIYNRRVTVINNTYINNTRVSYFGGPGGLNRPATRA